MYEYIYICIRTYRNTCIKTCTCIRIPYMYKTPSLLKNVQGPAAAIPTPTATHTATVTTTVRNTNVGVQFSLFIFNDDGS